MTKTGTSNKDVNNSKQSHIMPSDYDDDGGDGVVEISSGDVVEGKRNNEAIEENPSSSIPTSSPRSPKFSSSVTNPSNDNSNHHHQQQQQQQREGVTNKFNQWISRKVNSVYHHTPENNNNQGTSGVTASAHQRTKKPQKVLESVYKIGQFKADLPLRYLIVQCFMAGLYKSVGCHTFITVGGGVLGAVFFPVGLIAIVLTSAELFTGDLLILVVCFLGRKVHGRALLRNLCVSWIFNFCGTLVWASLIAYGSGAIEDKGQVDYAIELAEDKTSQPFGHILTKGIGANFLVCLALWQAMTADDVASKILAIWFPVVPFVINGLEHVVANMFFIPLGMMFGADITVGDMFLMNLIPSTIGNIIGGAFGIALSYWYLFQPTQKQAQLESKMHHAVNDDHSSSASRSQQQYRQLQKHMKNLKTNAANIFQQQHDDDDDDSSSDEIDSDNYDDDSISNNSNNKIVANSKKGGRSSARNSSNKQQSQIIQEEKEQYQD